MEGLDALSNPASSAPESAPGPVVGMQNSPTMATAHAIPQAQPSAPDPHARLRSMVRGMLAGFEGVDALGKSIATHGQQGGVQEVEAFRQHQAELQLQQQSAARQQAESEARIKSENAQANMSSAQLNILLHNAPLETQKLVIANQSALVDLLKNAGIPPMLIMPIIEGQSTDEHVAGLNAKANGDFVNNAMVAVHDEKFGGSGNTYGFNLGQAASVMLPKEKIAPFLATMQPILDKASAILGPDDPAVKIAQGRLDLFSKGDAVSARDLVNFNQMQLAQLEARVQNRKDITEFQQKQSAAAKEASDAQTAAVKAANEPTNQALSQAEKKTTIAKNVAETGKAQVETAKAGFEFGQEKREAGAIAQPDPTGFSSNLTQKEYDKRYDSFTKSKDMQTLKTLQGSYAQFQDVIQKLDKGEDMSGAESVVALFNAIGISATPLAGKGFRINQSTVEEHTTARGVGQAAYQKLLALKNGDKITPEQVRDYAGIAASVYKNQFITAVDEAHRQGLPADFLPQGGGKPIDSGTAEIFATAVAHQNPGLKGPAKRDAVVKAAKAAGWDVQ